QGGLHHVGHGGHGLGTLPSGHRRPQAPAPTAASGGSPVRLFCAIGPSPARIARCVADTRALRARRFGHSVPSPPAPRPASASSTDLSPASVSADTLAPSGSGPRSVHSWRRP